MTFRLNCIAALCAALPVAALAQDDKTMGTVTVTEPRMLSPGEIAIGEAALAPMRAATSDTARLLLDIPGVSLNGAGGGRQFIIGDAAGQPVGIIPPRRCRRTVQGGSERE